MSVTKSTLSLAFLICVVAVIAMIFLWVQPDPLLFGVIWSVIGAYLWSRVPKDLPPNQPKDDTQGIHSGTTDQ